MPAKSRTRRPRVSPKPALPSPSLSERLQNFRLENDLSYQDLAELISGVSSETVRRIATGADHSPTLLTASKIEKFLADREACHAA